MYKSSGIYCTKQPHIYIHIKLGMIHFTSVHYLLHYHHNHHHHQQQQRSKYLPHAYPLTPCYYLDIGQNTVWLQSLVCLSVWFNVFTQTYFIFNCYNF